ncbi:glutamate--cysteine ligase [Yinghuangia sp. ASG 101]|uniref:carboxylate-amine ligase n=1 Tax=Yinghuangia sp. ASG 101 TaxID=2896848 RepID=UPI001E433AE0|nr:glutamate--cysteine ligase [Yinghuangia sp. ASG 101]UGQ12917.1 glutamate--cysteine ligase [Yinghuangia sp. ASG 101]
MPSTAFPRPSIGVEEEFFLMGRLGRVLDDRAPQVVKTARDALGDHVQAEFLTSQIEVCTPPLASLASLRTELTRLRRAVAVAAAAEGCLVVASGTPVLAPDRVVPVTDQPRYAHMAARYGALVDQLGGGLCGCHVHLGTFDRAGALALGNRLRPWLPVIQALSANSPYVGGADTGYASWRSVMWEQWPTVGPAPQLDLHEYEHVIDALVRSDTILDRGMLYWHSRPSEHVPTLEIRVADVCADPDTTVLIAALLRGLASVCLMDIREGRPAPEVRAPLLTAAHRRAAQAGLAGVGLDPMTGSPEPAAVLLDRLVARATPALDALGDLATVHTLLDGVRRDGCGADRQRSAYRRTGNLTGVIDDLAHTTAPGIEHPQSDGELGLLPKLPRPDADDETPDVDEPDEVA